MSEDVPSQLSCPVGVRLQVTFCLDNNGEVTVFVVRGEAVTHGANLPGFRTAGDVDPHPIAEFELSDADAELAHRRGVVVATLVGATKLEKEARARQDALNVGNLRRLLGHRVRLALGSDSYRQDSQAEALYVDSPLNY